MIGDAQAELLARARELHARAVVEQNNGHPSRALALLRRAQASLDRWIRLVGADASAEQLTGAEHLAVAIMLSHAYPTAEVFGIERGLASLAQAQARAQSFDDPGLTVRLHSQHALLAFRAGNLSLAREQLDMAMRLLEHADANDRFAVLLNYGYVCLLQSRIAAARDLFVRAAQFAREQDAPIWRFKALHNLGYAVFLAGDLPGALGTMDEAASSGAEVSRGIPLLDRARVLVDAGLTGDADAALAQAGAIFAAERLVQDLAETELARAECALVAGDLLGARTFAAQAGSRFRRRGNDRWRRSAELVLLRADHAAARSPARLATTALTLATELRADGQRVGARIAQLVAAECLLSLGDSERAEQLVAQHAARSDPIAVRLHEHYLRAALAASAGLSGRVDPQASSGLAAGRGRSRAQVHVRAGLRALATYQASFGGIELRTASAVHGRRLAELDLALALEKGRPAAVLAAVERGRAASSRMPIVRPPDDPVSAELLAQLRQTLESIRSDPAQAVALQTRRSELERQIKARQWRLAGAATVYGTASLTQLQRQVRGAGAVVVAYFRVGNRLHAVVVAGGGSHLRELADGNEVDALIARARADLDVLAYERLPLPLRATASGSLRRGLTRLDELLVRPLKIGARRLVVIPTGALAALPWTSIPSRRGLPVVVSPSASAWVAGCQRIAAATAPVAATEVRGGGGVGVVVALAGPDLQRGEQEVHEIGRCRPGVRVVTAATRAQFADAMAGASLVHIAAHGQHQTQNPLFSSIRLADGALFAYELEHAPPQVVLSACELGVATVRPGDEALGLTSALLQLGSQTVVSGVARVGDRAAAEVMVAYHREQAGGCDPAEALARAAGQLDEPTPFVCFGA